MTKQTKQEIENLLYNLADYDVFDDYEIKNDILDFNYVQYGYGDYIEIYENAYKQKPELFEGIKNTFEAFTNSDLSLMSDLQWKFFKQYFNEMWEMATNSYFEGYPLPDNMEYPDLLNLKINLI